MQWACSFVEGPVQLLSVHWGENVFASGEVIMYHATHGRQVVHDISLQLSTHPLCSVLSGAGLAVATLWALPETRIFTHTPAYTLYYLLFAPGGAEEMRVYLLQMLETERLLCECIDELNSCL